MSAKTFFLWFGIFIQYPAIIGYTGSSNTQTPPPQPVELILSDVRNHEGQVSFTAQVINTEKSDLLFSWVDPSMGRPSTIHAQKMPVNLWVLIDSASVCKESEVDKYSEGLIRTLRSELHPDSVVSVVSYTTASLEVHINQMSIQSSPDIKVNCESTSLSTSYEKALTRLRDSTKYSGLPLHLWVYTSGNIQLSQDSSAYLKSREANVRLVLYNAIIQKEIKQVADQMKNALGAISVGLYNKDPRLLPARLFRLRFSAPYTLRGTQRQLELSAQSGSDTIAKAALSITFGRDWGYSWFELGLTVVAIVLGFILVATLICKVFRFYRARHCPSCGLRLRTNDRSCPFCATHTAALIGPFNLSDPTKIGKQDLIRLDGSVIELGSHRKSRLRMPKPTGKRRHCYVKIIPERRGEELGFRLVRTYDGIPIWVNGTFLKSERYLAPGDSIRMGHLNLNLAWRKHEHGLH